MEPTLHQYSPIEAGRLRAWIAKWIGSSWIWHAKFLSGTETSATQTRRPGPYVPRDLLKPAFPSLAADGGAGYGSCAFRRFRSPPHALRSHQPEPG